jgi:hypothetical protein
MPQRYATSVTTADAPASVTRAPLPPPPPVTRDTRAGDALDENEIEMFDNENDSSRMYYEESHGLLR